MRTERNWRLTDARITGAPQHYTDRHHAPSQLRLKAAPTVLTEQKNNSAQKRAPRRGRLSSMTSLFKWAQPLSAAMANVESLVVRPSRNQGLPAQCLSGRGRNEIANWCSAELDLHHSQIVFSVLIEVFSFYEITARCSVTRARHIVFVSTLIAHEVFRI